MFGEDQSQWIPDQARENAADRRALSDLREKANLVPERERVRVAATRTTVEKAPTPSLQQLHKELTVAVERVNQIADSFDGVAEALGAATSLNMPGGLNGKPLPAEPNGIVDQLFDRLDALRLNLSRISYVGEAISGRIVG